MGHSMVLCKPLDFVINILSYEHRKQEMKTQEKEMEYQDPTIHSV